MPGQPLIFPRGDHNHFRRLEVGGLFFFLVPTDGQEDEREVRGYAVYESWELLEWSRAWAVYGSLLGAPDGASQGWTKGDSAGLIHLADRCARLSR